MAKYKLTTEELVDTIKLLKAGDAVLLSGELYTARDAAHKRFIELLDAGKELPFDIRGKTIYYAGPTETPPQKACGSCGPTTSSRMDSFTPRLLDLGLTCTIGKGKRSGEVVNSLVKNKAVYLAAVGGAGALCGQCVKESRVVCFEDLGCESVKCFVVEDLPLIVACDSYGTSLYD